MSNIDIRFFGDVVPIEGKVDYEGFSEADLTVFNLEAAVCSGLDIRQKAGPHLIGSFSTLEGFSVEFHRPVGSFANNHAMDWGWTGVLETLEISSDLGISLFGVGQNLEAARTPYTTEINDVTIAFLGCCEIEYGIAQLEKPGVCPLDHSVLARIRSLRNQADIVVVSVHGGSELCPWPSPEHQMAMRALAEAGATIIHGHHPHVPQGYERYRGSVIFYGLGNFLVDPESWRALPHSMWSVVPVVSWSDGELVNVRIDTAVCTSTGTGVSVRESSTDEHKLHAEYLAKANGPLSDAAVLNALWFEHSARLYESVYSTYLQRKDQGRGKRWRNLLIQTFWRSYQPADDIDELLWYHLFSCDSHRRAIQTGLGIRSGELVWKRDPGIRDLYDDLCKLDD